MSSASRGASPAVSPAAPAGLRSPEWGGFDPARTRGRGLRDVWLSFRTATQLGWQMEANWTDPLLFFIYSVAKPVSSLVRRLQRSHRLARPESRAMPAGP